MVLSTDCVPGMTIVPLVAETLGNAAVAEVEADPNDEAEPNEEADDGRALEFGTAEIEGFTLLMIAAVEEARMPDELVVLAVVVTAVVVVLGTLMMDPMVKRLRPMRRIKSEAV